MQTPEGLSNVKLIFDQDFAKIPAQKTLKQTPEGLAIFGMQRRQPILGLICKQNPVACDGKD